MTSAIAPVAVASVIGGVTSLMGANDANDAAIETVKELVA